MDTEEMVQVTGRYFSELCAKGIRRNVVQSHRKKLICLIILPGKDTASFQRWLFMFLCQLVEF